MTTTTLSTGKLSRRLRGHRPLLGQLRGVARPRARRFEALKPYRQRVQVCFSSHWPRCGCRLRPPATTTDRSASAMTSKTRFVGWESTRPRLSFALPKETAAPSGSSVPSRKICSGRKCTRVSETCNEPSNGSRTITTKSGWSSVTGIARPASSYATRMKLGQSRKP